MSMMVFLNNRSGFFVRCRFQDSGLLKDTKADLPSSKPNDEHRIINLFSKSLGKTSSSPPPVFSVKGKNPIDHIGNELPTSHHKDVGRDKSPSTFGRRGFGDVHGNGC